MCEEVCMPGDAKVSLALPVAATATPDPTHGARLAAVVAGLPRADAAWKVTAARDAKTVTLTVTPAAGAQPAPKDLRFFADDNYVAYELPRPFPDGKGGFVLTLTIAPDAAKDVVKLRRCPHELQWLARRWLPERPPHRPAVRRRHRRVLGPSRLRLSARSAQLSAFRPRRPSPSSALCSSPSSAASSSTSCRASSRCSASRSSAS